MVNVRRLRRRIQYGAVYGFTRALIFTSRCMPRRAWLWTGGVLARVGYHLAPHTRSLTVRHLSLAFPDRSPREIRRLAKRNWTMLGKNCAEILRASRIRTLEELEEIMVTHGFEHFEAAHAAGKGVILLTCHLGPFDLQVTNCALRGLAPLVVGTRLKDPRLNALLWHHRNALGSVAIERGKDTFKLLKTLKSGGTVGILIDQDTRVKSCFVDFFGRPAATPVGAALLALKTGANVVPAYVHLGEDGKQHMHFLPVIETIDTGDEERDLVTNTQRYSDFIQEKVARHPDQWVWMHERWKTQPGDQLER